MAPVPRNIPYRGKCSYSNVPHVVPKRALFQYRTLELSRLIIIMVAHLATGGPPKVGHIWAKVDGKTSKQCNDFVIELRNRSVLAITCYWWIGNYTPDQFPSNASFMWEFDFSPYRWRIYPVLIFFLVYGIWRGSSLFPRTRPLLSRRYTEDRSFWRLFTARRNISYRLVVLGMYTRFACKLSSRWLTFVCADIASPVRSLFGFWADVKFPYERRPDQITPVRLIVIPPLLVLLFLFESRFFRFLWLGFSISPDAPLVGQEGYCEKCTNRLNDVQEFARQRNFIKNIPSQFNFVCLLFGRGALFLACELRPYQPPSFEGNREVYRKSTPCIFSAANPF